MKKISAHIGRWLGTVVTVAVTIGALYLLNAFQADRGETVEQPQGVTVTAQPTSSGQQPTGSNALRDVTSNWATYENASMEFSVRYPPGKGFMIREDSSSTVFIMVPNSDYGFVVRQHQNPSRLAPTGWLKTHFAELYRNVSVGNRAVTAADLKLTDVHLPNQLAVEVRVQNLPPYILLTAPHGDRILEIGGYTLEKELLYQILSTFRFEP